MTTTVDTECDYSFNIIIAGEREVTEVIISNLNRSRTYKFDGKKIKLQILTPGNDDFQNIGPSYYHGVHGIILSFKLSRQTSFHNTMQWLERINRWASSHICKSVVGFGQGSQVINYKDVKKLADQRQISFVEVRNYDAALIQSAFYSLVDDIYFNILKEQKKQQANELKSSVKVANGLDQPSATAETNTKVVPQFYQVGEVKSGREVERFVCEGSVVNISNSWKRWQGSFELYVKAAAITDNERKIAALLHCAGPDVQDIYFSLVEGHKKTTKTGDQLDYQRVMNILDKHFTVETNALYERLVFYMMHQNGEETIAQYCARLKQQAQHCEFGEMLEEQVRDRIVASCTSKKMTKLFIEKGNKLTLNKLIEIATLIENEQSVRKSI